MRAQYRTADERTNSGLTLSRIFSSSHVAISAPEVQRQTLEKREKSTGQTFVEAVCFPDVGRYRLLAAVAGV